MANLNHKILKSLRIPVPPLNEQRRIVARLNELLPQVDAYGKEQEALEKIETTLPDQLRASLLQEAVQGKLVPQRDDEPAVEKIGDALEDVPFAIPEKWKWKLLEDCVTFNPKVTNDDSESVSFVPMAAVLPGYENRIDGEQKRKWVDVKNGFSKFANGDVIMAKITPCFQNLKSAIVAVDSAVSAGSTEFHVMRCGEILLPEFLLWLIKSPYFVKYGVDHFKGTAGQQRIGTKDLKACPVPLPPIAEQRRIVARLNELLPLIKKLATTTAK